MVRQRKMKFDVLARSLRKAQDYDEKTSKSSRGIFHAALDSRTFETMEKYRQSQARRQRRAPNYR